MMTLDQEITLGCAFRYALGRMTYVVDSVAGEIERNVDQLSAKTRKQFVHEITEWLKTEHTMVMDVDRWKQCRAVIQKSLAL